MADAESTVPPGNNVVAFPCASPPAGCQLAEERAERVTGQLVLQREIAEVKETLAGISWLANRKWVGLALVVLTALGQSAPGWLGETARALSDLLTK